MGDRQRAPLVVDVVGDFMLERRLAPVDVAATRTLFDGADVVIANLDTVLSDRGTPVPKWANLRGPRDCARDLRAMGIDLVALANNHAMDTALDVVDTMHRLGGTTAIYATNALDRCLRDLHTAAADIIVSPRVYENAGRVLLGLEPEQGVFF